MDTNKFLEQRRKKQQEQANRQDSRKSNIPFLKLSQGKHAVRFLPKGNKQEKLPYKSTVNHTFKLRADGGGTVFVYAICYNWLFSHENCKENTIQPLIDMGKLTKQDIQAYKKYGCPVCNARKVLYDGGEDKETWQSCSVRGANYWNVLLRSDEKIYVWSASDTMHDSISGSIEMYLDINEKTGKPGPEAVDILDPETGYDHIITATGEKNNRRYKVDIKPKARPIGALAEGERPLDLMVVVAETFKSYGEMCQLLRRMQGKLLASYGFEYGVVMPDENPRKNVDLDDDDDEDSNDLKAKKANVKTNPSSIPWDDEDEENPKLKKSSKKSEPPPKKSTPSVDEDFEDDEEEEEPVSKKSARSVESTPKNKTANIKVTPSSSKSVAPWGEDDDDEEDVDNEDVDTDDKEDDDADFEDGFIVDKKTGKRLF